MAVDYFPSLVLRPTPSFSMLHAIKGLFYVTLYPGYPCNVENIGWPGYEAISICAVLIWKLRGSMWASAGMRLITLHAVYILHTSSAFLEPHEHWSGMNLQSLSKCSSSWLCSSNLLQPNCWLGHGIFLNLQEAMCLYVILIIYHMRWVCCYGCCVECVVMGALYQVHQ